MENKSKIIRNGAIIAAVVVFLFVGAAFVLSLPNQPKSFSATLAEVRTQAPINPPTCLATMENVSLRIPSLEQAQIYNAVSVSINDIPAGTKVTVSPQTYDGSNVTGTVTYGNNFGSFNFVARKVSGPSDWIVTSFALCQ